MTISISAAQRDALYEHILSRLSGIGDVWLSISTGNIETAKRLGREYSDELRLLLDDLDWGEQPDEEQDIELSAPPDVLHRIFSRLKSTTDSQRLSEESEWAEMRAFIERNALVSEACDVVLAELETDQAA